MGRLHRLERRVPAAVGRDLGPHLPNEQQRRFHVSGIDDLGDVRTFSSDDQLGRG